MCTRNFALAPFAQVPSALRAGYCFESREPLVYHGRDGVKSGPRWLIGSGAELQRAARGLFLSALRAGHGCTSFDPFLVMMVMAMMKMMNMKMITGVRFAKMGPIWLQKGADTGQYQAFGTKLVLLGPRSAESGAKVGQRAAKMSARWCQDGPTWI